MFPLEKGEWAPTCDLRWVQGPVTAVAILTLPTLVAMARRTVRRSVLTKSRTAQVCGAKQGLGHASSPIAEQEAAIRLVASSSSHLFLKRRCAALAAEAVRLPTDDLCHR